MSCFASFDKMCMRIVCPNRLKVNERDLLERQVRNKNLQYKLFNVSNSRGQNLSCLIFIRDLVRYPTVMYLHGNGGSKLELLPIIRSDTNQTTNFCAFDFSGCGKSDGQYITYGENEVDDIFIVMNHLSVNFGIKEFHLWGRSMGATSAILCGGYKKIKIASMILDSPFSNLEKVIENVSVKQNFPSLVFMIGFYFIKKRVTDIVNTDIFEENFIEALSVFKDIPIMFAYSCRDQVVLPEDVISMYQAYQGVKRLVPINSNHAEERPIEFINEALRFVNQKSVKECWNKNSQQGRGKIHSMIVGSSKQMLRSEPILNKISLNSRRSRVPNTSRTY